MSTAVETASRSKRWIPPLIAFLLAAAVIVPPLVSLNRFHRRIAESVGNAIGRPVRMSSVSLRLLPRPGLEIAGFVIEEDPAFGVEPLLRCDHVTAYPRLLSLWRGRMEIARIGLDEPSLNLVRNGRGQWNFDSLFSQARQLPNVPTAEPHPAGRPRFPYIDAGNARVNFKFGDEKMPFAFLNADLSVRLANPGEWRVQFVAQPVRTDLDLDLANTGVFRLEGSLRSAATASQMPVQLHAAWTSAPLGQLSRMLSGSDAGWRGAVDATAEINGNVDHASLKVVAQGRGIHRAEFEPHQALDLEATCRAGFSRASRAFDALTCLVPTGEGHLLLTGDIQGLGARTQPSLSLEINRLPVASALDGLRLVRSGFAPSLDATGVINGHFMYAEEEPDATPQLQGEATVTDATLGSPNFEKPVALPPLHFTAGVPFPDHPHPSAAHSETRTGTRPTSAMPLTLRLDPVLVGAPPSLSVAGAFTPSGFSLHLAGQPRIHQLVALGKQFGMVRDLTLAFAPPGSADVDLTVRGPWIMPVADPDHPAMPAMVDGTVRLRNAQVTAPFLARPLQLPSAQAAFTGNRVDWTATAMSYGPVRADGTMTEQIFCETPGECLPHFTLRLPTLDAATAQSTLLGPIRKNELLEQLLDRIDGNQPSWPSLNGEVRIGTFTLGTLTVRDLDASLRIEGTSVLVPALTGRALDGQLRLAGSMKIAHGAPRYSFEAQLDHAAIPAVAAVFEENWGSGSLNLKSTLQMSGLTAAQLAASATGHMHWEWTHGALPFSEAGEEPNALAHFDRWTADGLVSDSMLSLERSRVTSRPASGDTVAAVAESIRTDAGEGAANQRTLTGTITFNRELKLSGPHGLLITGSLQHPEEAGTPPASSESAPSHP